MPDLDLVLRASRAILATAVGEPAQERPACVGVRGGQIRAITSYDETLEARRVVELGDDEVLLPGLVDTHVHVNEPGRTEWEGFATATRAAAAGGITTIIDMPLNSIPPTIDVPALDAKRAAAHGKCYVDVGFWGGAVPSNLGQLRPLFEAGVFGFKCFLLHSGVDEFPALDNAGMRSALAEVNGFDGLLIVHAEDAHTIATAPEPNGHCYADFLVSRPRAAEERAIADVIAAARDTGGRAHVLHLADADALDMLRESRRHGDRISVETCPHYLSFTAEEVPDGATQFKCCPPIREEQNRERLWAGLRDGDIDCVVSDHSPSTPALKRLDTGDFGAAWGGISSLQLSLSAVWTGARQRGASLVDVVGWMAERPAALAGLRRKGRIAVGYDADFAVLAPDQTFIVDPARLEHRHALTPYAGRALSGIVRQSWVRGSRTGARPHGRLLTRGDA
ncbi:MAG: allantoinase AllB [Geodermatophilaceae bacterium]|nr:allantoinase AllB [Geodermatophilaceae bacterium]